MEFVFAGEIYAKTDLATGDGTRRFETSELRLSWAYITVETFSQDFGDSSSQPVTIPTTAGLNTLILENVDISTLYFLNTGAGSNGRVNIIGIKASA